MSKINFSEVVQDIMVLLTRAQQGLLLDILKEPTRAWEHSGLSSWTGEVAGWKTQVEGFVVSIAASEHEIHVHLNNIPCLLTKNSEELILAKIKELETR